MQIINGTVLDGTDNKFKQLNLTIKDNSIFGLIGINGAGKLFNTCFVPNDLDTFLISIMIYLLNSL